MKDVEVGASCVGQASCTLSVGDGTLNGQAHFGEKMMEFFFF